MAGSMKIPGSIWSERRPDGTVVWKVEVSNGTTPDGKRRRTRYTVRSKAEADRLRKEHWIERQRRSTPPSRQETLATFAEWWLQVVKRERLRESTLGDYEYRIKHWILPRFGRRRLGDITPPDIESWMRDLRRTGSVSTVNGARTILNQLMKYAHASGRIDVNPVALTQPLKRSHSEPTAVQDPWTVEEVRDALAAVLGSDVELLVVLGVVQGLRRGEILGLHWADIDFEAGTLAVRRGLKQARVLAEDGTVSVQLVEDATKTRASQRVLPLGPLVAEVLMRHRARQDAQRQSAGAVWIESDLVFTTSRGTAVSPSNIRRELVRRLNTAGVRVIRIHDMRHTAAVRALEQQTPLEAVSQALGHSDVNMTKSIYAPNVPGFNGRFVEANENLYRTLDAELEELVMGGEQAGTAS